MHLFDSNNNGLAYSAYEDLPISYLVPEAFRIGMLSKVFSLPTADFLFKREDNFLVMD